MIAIVFLTVKPIKKVFDFITLLKRDNYDIFVCIDDNTHKIPKYDTECIKLIKYRDGVAEKCGFKNSVTYAPDRACSRDKALYYFCIEEPEKYDYIWMIEEDVFIPDVNTIYNIDVKYPESDLLCRSNKINRSGEIKTWSHFKKLVNKIELPWCYSMICAVRVSKKLLELINAYAKEKKELLFCEALFNTLAYQNELAICIIPELSNIKYNNQVDLDLDTYNNEYLYHPIKDINTHYKLRKKL